jgi:hypothetical protein
MQFLESPMWDGISGIIAIIALFLTLFLERDRLFSKLNTQRKDDNFKIKVNNISSAENKLARHKDNLHVSDNISSREIAHEITGGLLGSILISLVFLSSFSIIASQNQIHSIFGYVLLIIIILVVILSLFIPKWPLTTRKYIFEYLIGILTFFAGFSLTNLIALLFIPSLRIVFSMAVHNIVSLFK